MDWLSYECQNLAFKLKDQVPVENTCDASYILKLLSHEKTNDFSLLQALHSVNRLLTQDF